MFVCFLVFFLKKHSSFDDILAFIEKQYDDILAEESRIKRNPKFQGLFLCVEELKLYIKVLIRFFSSFYHAYINMDKLNQTWSNIDMD